MVKALGRVRFAILRVEGRPGLLAGAPSLSLPSFFRTPNGVLRVWARPVDRAASAAGGAHFDWKRRARGCVDRWTAAYNEYEKLAVVEGLGKGIVGV